MHRRCAGWLLHCLGVYEFVKGRGTIADYTGSASTVHCEIVRAVKKPLFVVWCRHTPSIFGESTGRDHCCFFSTVSASEVATLDRICQIYLARNQAMMARMMRYAPVGNRLCGSTLRRNGSSMISTSTGGTCCIRVLFVV